MVIILLLSVYLAVQTSAVQTYLVRHVTDQLSQKFHTNISVQRVNISFFNKIILKGVCVEDQQRDTLLYVENLVATIGNWSIKQKEINLSSVNLVRTNVFVSVDKNHVPNYNFLIDSIRSDQNRKDTIGWKISCNQFLFDKARVGYSYYQLEENHQIDLKDIYLAVSNLNIDKDSVSLRIDDLKLNDHKYFSLSKLNGNLVSYKKIIKLNGLQVLTSNSVITRADVVFDQSELGPGNEILDSYIDLNLYESEIDLRDIASLIPEISGMDQKVGLSGRIFGKISELKGRNLSIQTGKSTAINCDFYVNGLPKLDQTFIQLDLKNSTLDFRDIAAVRLPESAKRPYPNITPTLLQAGKINYTGNFTGFLSDFVAYGSIQSAYGHIDTDLSFKPVANNSLIISGHLRTINFNLGRFTKSSSLGKVTFGGQIDGRYNEHNKVLIADVNGKVDSIMYNGYNYRNIVMDGAIRDKQFAGDVSVDDQNLQFTFAGMVNTKADSSVFNFNLDLQKADLVALGIDSLHRRSNLAMHINANFTGNTIDDMRGSVQCESGEYENENGELKLNSLNINTLSGEKNKIELNSDFLNAAIEGNYRFRTLPKTLKNLLFKYLPSSGASFEKTNNENEFSLNVSIKNTAPVTRVFFPDLKLSAGFITGKIDEKADLLDVYAEMEEIAYQNNAIKGYSLSVHSGEELEMKNRIEELAIGSKQRLYNLALLGSASADEVNTKLMWNNYAELSYSGELEGQFRFSKTEGQQSHIDVNIAPGKIYIADTLWLVNPSYLSIDSNRIEVENILISHRDQFLSINGAVSKNSQDQLNVQLNNFNLNNLNLLTGDKNRILGTMAGTVSFFDIYERPLFLADIKVDGFNYNETAVGDLSILSKWDIPSKAIQAELIVSDKNRQQLYGYGSYYPQPDSLDLTINADGLSLALLGPVLEGSFQNIHGEATGELKIKGGLVKIMMYGDIYGANAGLALSYLQVDYRFSDLVRFRGDSIIFPRITILDTEGNTGIFDGSIRHDNFSNMDYKLSINSKNLQVINTTPAINGRFYGKAYANGLVRVTGRGTKVFIDGSARTLPHTALNISLDYGEEAQEYDFIRFANANEAESTPKMPKNKQTKDSGVFMNFDITATPDVRFQLVYNSQVGDMIRAQGSGNLQLKIDPDYNIELYGDYSVDRGDYLFTLKNVINKKFDIDRGGTIQWSGDPYNAKIDLNAIYRVKASLSELFANSNTSIDYTQRIPINCKIELDGQLTNPNIGFDIEFPSSEERINDEVRQFLSTEEDMNKQILSLLVMGRFYTPEYLRGTYESQSSGLVGNTASELFSNQLSNWLSQISNDFDIGVNYRPGNQISDDEIEVALSTQIFNDRVSINGNISNNTNPAGTTLNNNSSAIVGDFDVNVKLTNNGKLQFKAYNHSNNNIIYETSPYKQGIGLSYRENYDNFEELWRKFLNLFRKKRNKL